MSFAVDNLLVTAEELDAHSVYQNIVVVYPLVLVLFKNSSDGATTLPHDVEADILLPVFGSVLLLG